MSVLQKEDKNVVKKDSRFDDAKIFVRNVSRVFRVRSTDASVPADFVAIKDVNLEVRKGEFLTIVGPSGCGKSTLLDMIAGLAKQSSGELYIDGKLITGPALDRGIILQGYALFPWRTVRRNVEFGLEIKGIRKSERADISQKFVDLVGVKL